MARTGRPRKPTALKLLEGTARPDREQPNEPKPALARPTCPRHLSRAARQEWRRVVPELEALGLLAKIDRASLAAYCQCWARWIEAEELVAEQGLVAVTDKGNVIQHPAVGIANTALGQMRAFLTEFGMTPASRTRISVKPPTKGQDATEAFLFGAGGAS